MEAEETQEHGRKGVALFKRWLESTTYIELEWNVYEKPNYCTLPLLNGTKKFDLVGNFLGSNQRPLAVECKRYSSKGDQPAQFSRFLAEAYSATLFETKVRGGDIAREFIWATTHPFDQSKWSKVHSHTAVKSAVENNPDVLGDHTSPSFDLSSFISDDTIRTVADRIWLLVMNEKQDELSLTQDELLDVWKVLSRKKGSLI